MPELTISMLLEFDSPLVFHKWIPDGEQDAIVFDNGDLKLRIWFDVKCATWASPATREELSRTVNVHLYRAHVTAVCDISVALAMHLQKKSLSQPIAPDSNVETEYNALGRSVHQAVAQRVNRLIEYAFSSKGQYWARRVHFDEDNPGQFFTKTQAIAFLADNRKFRFCPDNVIRIAVSLSDQQRSISPSDWDDIKRFVVNNSSTPIVGNLLARARELAGEGYERASILEAVSALEIRLNKFASERDEDLLPDRLKARLESGRLSTLIEKVGLRGAFATIIPFLLSENEMPLAILEQCRAAIETRNNVVHRGQREIGQKKLRQMLLAIEGCCSRFDVLRAPAAPRDKEATQ